MCQNLEVFREHSLESTDGSLYTLVEGELWVVLQLFLKEVGGLLVLGAGTGCLVPHKVTSRVHLVQHRTALLINRAEDAANTHRAHVGVLRVDLSLIGHPTRKEVDGNLVAVLELEFGGCLPGLCLHGVGMMVRPRSSGKWKPFKLATE